VTDIETQPAAKEHTVPPLARRVRGVLLDPVATFEALDPSWGILGPWLTVMAAGLIFAIVSIAQVDYAALGAQRQAYGMTFASDQMKRLAQGQESPIDPGKAAKFGAHFVLIGGPVLGSILGIVFTGFVLFGAAALFSGKKDLLRAIVVSAHAKLVALVSYGALFAGTVLGNPTPATDPHNVVDEVARPVLAAALAIFDPIAIWHSVLLAIGLTVALGVAPKRSALVAAGYHVALWLLWIGYMSLQLLGRK